MLLDDVFYVQSPGLDGGNTAANVFAFVIPCKAEVIRVAVAPAAALTGNLHVSFDSYSVSTQGAEDVGSIEVPAGAAAFASYHDEAGSGVVLNMGDKVLVQVDNAGDSGENFYASLCLRYLSQTDSNSTTTTTETA